MTSRRIIFCLALGFSALVACRSDGDGAANGSASAISEGPGEAPKATDAGSADNASDAGAEAAAPLAVKVRSLLPKSEAQTLQAVFDRLAVRPAACSSEATIMPPTSGGPEEWSIDARGIDAASDHLTASEATDVAAIFARLEVAPGSSVTFFRADHTECAPQDGADSWEARYEQIP